MAEPVVHELEVVEVERHHCDGAGVAAFQRVAKTVAEQRPVRQTRQRVVEGLMTQLVLQSPPLRDVMDEGAEGRRVPDPDRPDRQLHRKVATALVDSLHLGPLADEGARTGREISSDAGLMCSAARFGHDQLRQGCPESLVAAPAERLGRSLVPLDHDPVVIDGDVRRARRLDDPTLLLLAGPELRLGILLGRDVGQDAVGLETAVREHQQTRLVADPDVPPIADAHADGLIEALGGPEVFVLRGGHSCSVVGVDQGVPPIGRCA